MKNQKKSDKNIDLYEKFETDINKRFPIGAAGANRTNADKVKKELVIKIVEKDKKDFQMNITTGILLPLALFIYSIIYSNIVSVDQTGLLLVIIIGVISAFVILYGIILAKISNESRNLSFQIELLQRKRDQLLQSKTK